MIQADDIALPSSEDELPPSGSAPEGADPGSPLRQGGVKRHPDQPVVPPCGSQNSWFPGASTTDWLGGSGRGSDGAPSRRTPPTT